MALLVVMVMVMVMSAAMAVHARCSGSYRMGVAGRGLREVARRKVGRPRGGWWW